MDLGVVAVVVCAAAGVGYQAWHYEQARQRDIGRLCVLLANLASAVEQIAAPANRLGTHAMQPGDGRAALRARLAERAAQRT